MGGSGKKFFSKGAGNFLAGADLSDPDARIGRRKRARLKAGAAIDAELSAEKRPRSSQRWTDAERSLTKLPTAAGVPEGDRSAGGGGAQRAAADGADTGPGKKKSKRLAVLEAKKARKEQKKMGGAVKATEDAAKAVKGKAKGGDVSAAAAELLERCRSGPAAQQQLLCLVSERVSGAPEKDLDCFDVFFEMYTKGNDAYTRQLALLSAVAVFKDLVPAYRIREPTEQEKATVRSKPVLALERYELGLLQKYRKLLPLLENAMKRDPVVFAPALSALIVAASEFNYRQRLIGTAVKHASSADDAVRNTIAAGLKEMVENDQRLESSRELVLAVGRVAQGAAAHASRGRGSGALKEELVEVLLRLPIGKAEAALAREGALDADPDEDVRKGLAEASIGQSAEKIGKAEAELLTEVFVVYLRILRQRQAHARGLLVSALTGLARWGQQVNIELLLEILAELKGAVKDAVERCDEHVALQGLYCALVLLSGPSQALITDVTWLADALRSSLTLALPSLQSTFSESDAWPPRGCFRLDDDQADEDRRLRISEPDVRRALQGQSVPALVLNCVDAALKCPQAYGRASDAALGSLVEQLVVLAAACDSHVGLAMLREAALLLRKNQRLQSLLDVEGGLFGMGGVSERAITVVWHLQPLIFSLVPEVEKASRSLPAAVPKHARTSMAELFPARDGQAWLASEVGRHLGAGLGDKKLVPAVPGAGGKGAVRGGRIRQAPFLSEAELTQMCGSAH
eukprot:TRINITY_DN37445_c0_g1_i1.p1 TRINITY_DN37445_c0_g1~~TRINITY_DN37445_c0_g1_i1.p1  ORF type:complete len:746 (+),score=211.06 TRINITY_DN37445_c0_g1_i1:62-2299(+)